MEVVLRRETINEYNVGSCKENLQKLLTEYIRIKYAYANIKKQGKDFYNSSTGASYEYKPEMATLNYKDRIGDKIAFKIDCENEVIQMQYDIQELYDEFTDIEKSFFEIVLLANRPQKVVEDKYLITKSGLEPIKQSCIVKSAMKFNIAVKK